MNNIIMLFESLFAWMPPVMTAITVGIICFFIVLALFSFISGVLKALPFV